MKLVGWLMSAAAFAAATGASAQGLQPLYDIARLPLTVVSDFGGPYAAMPPEAPPRYAPYAYRPVLLPPREVYGVLRDNGYSPLGAPLQRGMVYIIAAIDLDGDDGRVVIDARTGRVLRFMPAFRMGHVVRGDDEAVATYGPAGPLPPAGDIRPALRPAQPRVASRTPSVPLPRAAPHAVVPPKTVAPVAAAHAPTPAQQSAAVQTTGAAPAASAAAADKPSATIQPTQEMPAAQGLE